MTKKCLYTRYFLNAQGVTEVKKNGA